MGKGGDYARGGEQGVGSVGKCGCACVRGGAVDCDGVPAVGLDAVDDANALRGGFEEGALFYGGRWLARS